MTQQLIILGDSLMDSGNTAGLLSLIGQNPFEASKYDGGGNTKASDGPVLGEWIALEMGAGIDDAQLISVLSPVAPQPVQVHNYAHAGARTDAAPGYSLPLVGQVIGIGLQEQKEVLLERKPFYLTETDVDVLLSCGGNDIRDALKSVDAIQAVISTETLKDDRQLAYEIAKPIAKNLKKTVRHISSFTDEIAIAGPPPLDNTPETQDWLTNFSTDDQDKALHVINLIGQKLTHKLEKKYQDYDNIAMINGEDARDQLTEISFVDDFHPDTKTSAELATIIVEDATAQLATFGF